MLSTACQSARGARGESSSIRQRWVWWHRWRQSESGEQQHLTMMGLVAQVAGQLERLGELGEELAAEVSHCICPGRVCSACLCGRRLRQHRSLRWLP